MNRQEASIRSPKSLFIVAGCLMFAVHLILMAADSRMRGVDDFGHWFYTGALSLELTGSPYDFADAKADLLRYPYPPMTAYLAYPLHGLERLTAQHCWSAFNAALTFVFAWQLAGLGNWSGENRRRLGWTLVVLCFLSAFPHQLTGNFVGQVHNLVAVPLAAAFLSLRSGRLKWSGFWLALAALVKVFPALLIVALICSRERKQRAAAIWAVLFLAIAVGVTWSHHWEYVNRFLLANAQPRVAGAHYLSLAAVIARTTASFGNPGLAMWIIAGTGLLIVGSLLVVARFTNSLDATFCTGICAMLLVTPNLGAYHLPLIFIVFVTFYEKLHRTSQETAPGSRRNLQLLCLAGMLTFVPVPMRFLGFFKATEFLVPFLVSPWGAPFQTPPTYGVLIFAFISGCEAIAHRSRKPRIDNDRQREGSSPQPLACDTCGAAEDA